MSTHLPEDTIDIYKNDAHVRPRVCPELHSHGGRDKEGIGQFSHPQCEGFVRTESMWNRLERQILHTSDRI